MRRAAPQAAFSLVELLIAIALMTGAVQVLVRSEGSAGAWGPAVLPAGGDAYDLYAVLARRDGGTVWTTLQRWRFRDR